jgi:molecular chaperone HscC
MISAMIVGIDLGTTNSLVAAWRDGRPQLIPNALGQFLTPSCVSVAENGEMLVGAAAKDRILTFPERSAAVFKRYMGTEKRISLEGKDFRPEELSALVLKSLKADAEAFLQEPVTEAVITVPAYFNDTQRKATRTAGQLAGFKVERLLNEPTAAALAYGLHQAQEEAQFLVFDLGGGTFDVSVMEMFSGVMEVRATAGDNFLGGEDFVEVLVDGFMAFVGEKAGVDERKPAVLARLQGEAERVKRELSTQDLSVFRYQHGKRELSWEVSVEAFERLSVGLLERLRRPVERALRDAKISAASLGGIVMVGGATRMPIVHRMVARMFGRFPKRDIDPDQSIALGAAVQAGLKARDAALEDVVMTDVCPYSLGVEVVEHSSPNHSRAGVFMPIIERNTVIPASRSKIVFPVRENQTKIDVKVYQGESRDVADNILLGTLDVALPNIAHEQRQVDIRFTYDINGLLEVEATIVATQVRRSLVIEQSPGAMSPEDVRKSLEALGGLKIAPRTQAENRAVIERLKRLFEMSLGDRREWVARQLLAYEGVLERQDPREIAQARVELLQSLDQFEGAPVL